MAITADSVIVELEARTRDFDSRVTGSTRTFESSMTQIERSASRAEGAVARSANQIANSTALVAQRSRLLGYQIGDIGTQLASGASPFLVLAQQAPQVANALEGTTGAAGKMAAFFSGPWGAALLAAGSILGIVLEKNLGAADAKRTHQKAAVSLSDAIRALSTSLDQENASTQRSIFLTLAKAQADRTAAIEARKRAAADLSAGVASLSRLSNLSPEGAELGAAEAARREEKVARLRERAAQAERDVQIAERNTVAASAPIIRNQIAEALDARTRATNRYERANDLLYSKLKRGQITEAQYASSVRASSVERDRALQAAEDADKAAGRAASARRKEERAAAAAQKKEAREAIRDAEQLKSAYESLYRQLDPSAAAADDFVKSLQTIKDARMGGLIDDLRAFELSLKAIAAEEARLIEQRAKRGKELFGDVGDLAAPTDVAGLIRAQDEAEERLQRQREDNIEDLADLYETAFHDGAGGIWEEFKRQGIRAIALLLAQWTAAQFNIGGASGGGGNIIGSLIGSFFGRASGGYVGPGQTVRVNENRPGVELLRMGPQGGQVIPLGQAKAARPASQTVVQQTFVLDNRYGITTPQLIDYVNRTAEAKAAEAGTASYKQSMRDAPASVAKVRRFGERN